MDYRLKELSDAFYRHYPEEGYRASTFGTAGVSIPHIPEIIAALENLEKEERFVSIEKRPWMSYPIFPHLFYEPLNDARKLSPADVRAILANTYKGIIMLKTPFDLALYPRLIWELKPKNILEFGTFQGGASLWLADQLSAFGLKESEVHSFEYYSKIISEAARHPQLHFHHTNLLDHSTLDTKLFERLEHPWLIIEDSHVNLENLFGFLNKHMKVGDYIVIEDTFCMASTAANVAAVSAAVSSLGFLVDTFYTDAFGLNMTAAPNLWLKKFK